MTDYYDPNSNSYYVPADGGGYKVVPATAYETGTVDAALIGAGKTFTDIGRGIQDAYYGLTNNEQGRAEIAQRQAAEQQAYTPLSQHQGVATMVGEALPYVASAPLGGTSIAGQAALAGGLGAARQTGGLQERAMQGALEGTIGGVGAGVGGMAGRVANRIRGAGDDIASRFVQQGGRVTPGQAMDSNLLRTAEAGMESAGLLGSIGRANQAQLQSKVSKAIGQSVPDLSDDGLIRAAGEIGERFNMATAGKTVDIPESLTTRLQTLTKENPFVEIPDNMGQISGDLYQQLRSQLSGMARSEARSATKTPGMGEYLSKTIDQLDEAFEAAAGAADKKLLRTAREQWKNLLALEKGAALTADGLVNPKSARTALRNSYGKHASKERMLPETRDMMDFMSASASRGLSPIVGDSGTATRALLPIVGAGLGGYGGDAEGALMGGLLGIAAGRGYAGMGNLLAGGEAPLARMFGGGVAHGLLE